MAILFNKVEHGNPANPQAPKLWYPVLKSTGLVREKEVAKLLADETTLNPKEAEFAVAQLFKVVTRQLHEGKTVELGSLGTMRLTAHAEGSATPAEVTAQKIKNVTIRFIESDATKDEMKSATFIAIDSL